MTNCESFPVPMLLRSHATRQQHIDQWSSVYEVQQSVRASTGAFLLQEILKEVDSAF